MSPFFAGDVLQLVDFLPNIHKGPCFIQTLHKTQTIWYIPVILAPGSKVQGYYGLHGILRLVWAT